MHDIYVIQRTTKQKEKEKIYGRRYIEFLYEPNRFCRRLAKILLPLFCKYPFFSRLYGKLQRRPRSKRKILPFIKDYQVDSSEFLKPVEEFRSFNDFFIRKLKPSARPIEDGEDTAILPTDGRFLVFENIHKSEGIFVKGKKFSLETLLGNATLAHKYLQGSMLIARLAPVDYHRFHFPVDCTPSQAALINGYLYSVNPIALRKNIEILTENKRMITHLTTHHFGTVLFIEVGATYVGSIHQTFTPERNYAKGEEKGYFSCGGR